LVQKEEDPVKKRFLKLEVMNVEICKFSLN